MVREVLADGRDDRVLTYCVGLKLEIVKQPGAAHRCVAEVVQLDGAGALGGADGRFAHTVGEGGRQRIFERI